MRRINDKFASKPSIIVSPVFLSISIKTTGYPVKNSTVIGY
jgi:hypothetical protein